MVIDNFYDWRAWWLTYRLDVSWYGRLNVYITLNIAFLTELNNRLWTPVQTVDAFIQLDVVNIIYLFTIWHVIEMVYTTDLAFDDKWTILGTAKNPTRGLITRLGKWLHMRVIYKHQW